MEFNIQPLESTVPTELAPYDEVVQIIEDIYLGEAIREQSMFRIWRMWDTKSYLHIESDDPDAVPGTPIYGTFSDFMKEFRHFVDVSRSKIYSRIRVYSQLRWIGFGNEAMINMMSVRPGVYEKACNYIFYWDQEDKAPNALKTDVFGELYEEDGVTYNEETRENIYFFIRELEEHDSVQGALDYLKHDVMGRPEVRMFLSNGHIRIVASGEAYDQNGNQITEEFTEFSYYSEDAIPDWVKDELSRKYHIGIDR